MPILGLIFRLKMGFSAQAVCKPLGLSVRGLGGEDTPIGADGTCDISVRRRFCISEREIIEALYTGVEGLLGREKAAGAARAKL